VTVKGPRITGGEEGGEEEGELSGGDTGRFEGEREEEAFGGCGVVFFVENAGGSEVALASKRRKRG